MQSNIADLKEQKKIYDHERYLKIKDKIVEQTSRWKKDNPQKVRNYLKKWQHDNKYKCKEYTQKWIDNNMDKHMAKIKRGNDKFRNDLPRKLFHAAKRRSKLYDIPFKIELNDIIVPTHCPVLGIPLIMGNKHAHDNSPSLDRIIPELGYIKGNIVVVSHKANTIKNNATIEDLEKVYMFYKSLIGGVACAS